MILLQKFNSQNKELKGWTQVFKNEDELLEFLEKEKGYLLGYYNGGGCSLYIEEVKEYKNGGLNDTRKETNY